MVKDLNLKPQKSSIFGSRKSTDFHRNKKAWIRIVEAVIAIVIVSSAILVISLRQGKESDTESVYEKQRQILETISNNNNYRMEILSSDNLPVEIGMENPDYTIDEFVSKTIQKNWDFNILICEIDDICSVQTPVDRDVYVSETIISANFDKYEKPRKIEFFVWIK